MFESAALGRACSNKEFEEKAPQLRMRLFNAQLQCIERKIPVLITVAGLVGSGRGAIINLLSEWMDSKHVQNHVFWLVTDEEKARPWPWRFWRQLPAAGQTAVFYDGWYGEAMRQRCCKDVGENEFPASMHRWQALESGLAESGMAIIKLWLHLNKKDHARALKERQENRALVHFSPSDKKIAADYDGMVSAASRAIMLTDRDNAPWSIIDAADPNFRNLSVVKAIIAGIERTIAAHDARAARLKVLESVPEVEEDARESLVSTLDAIDLSSVQAPEHYQKELKRLQKEIYQLSFRAYKKGISSTLIFEGWDAAGKGGAIRRLTAGTDARITRVIPISAPSDEELAHHYLWRFWRHIPRAGFITIYDRSWYGRVLVERVEKLTPKEDWARAYAEINHFEHQLTNNGNILLKFWLHISPEEQLRRFREREAIPWKRYKITDEDWRNRDKWPEYARAADEMFLRTSTEDAPWHVVPAENKKYARLMVLRIYRDALKRALR